MKSQVFHDPSGRRGRLAGQAVAALLALVTLLTAGFAATLALSPRLPSLTLKDPRNLTALHVDTPHRKGGKPAWNKAPRHASPATRNSAAKPLSVGFYVSWDSNSR